MGSGKRHLGGPAMKLGLVAGLAISLGSATCAHAPLAATSVTTFTEAQAATGKVVRVVGIAQREKLGDSVATQDLNIRCQEPRFPDGAIGKQVTVEGKLEVVMDPEATIGPNGELSQGTAPGTSSFVIRSCALRSPVQP